MDKGPKRVVWMGDSLKELKGFPRDVQDEIGFALYEAQTGGKSAQAKPLSRSMPGCGVFEIVSDFDTDTFRAVYTVKLASAVYVLHCFKKKSKSGSAIPQRDLGLIKARYKAALEHAEKKQKE